MFLPPRRKNIFLSLINFRRGGRTFFLGSTPFRRGGSPAPFWFPYFGGAQEQWLFLLLLRHRAACNWGWGNAPCRLFLSRVHFLTWCWWFCWGLQAWINIDDLRKCHIKTDITCSMWANVPTNDGEASTINVSVLGLRLFSLECRKTARQGFLCATKQRI